MDFIDDSENGTGRTYVADDNVLKNFEEKKLLDNQPDDLQQKFNNETEVISLIEDLMPEKEKNETSSDDESKGESENEN